MLQAAAVVGLDDIVDGNDAAADVADEADDKSCDNEVKAVEAFDVVVVVFRLGGGGSGSLVSVGPEEKK